MPFRLFDVRAPSLPHPNHAIMSQRGGDLRAPRLRPPLFHLHFTRFLILDCLRHQPDSDSWQQKCLFFILNIKILLLIYIRHVYLLSIYFKLSHTLFWKGWIVFLNCKSRLWVGLACDVNFAEQRQTRNSFTLNLWRSMIDKLPSFRSLILPLFQFLSLPLALLSRCVGLIRFREGGLASCALARFVQPR